MGMIKWRFDTGGIEDYVFNNNCVVILGFLVYKKSCCIQEPLLLAEAIDVVLSENLSKYNIQVVSTAIEDMDFTDAFTNAVEAKQVAAQNKLQAEIEQAQKIMEEEAAAEMAVIQANAAAETAKIKAQADLEVIKIEADGVEYAGQKEAAANKALADTLTEELLEYYYIQNWDGKLPDTYVGSEDVSAIIAGNNGGN